VRSVHASERGLTSVFNLEVYARHEFFVGEERVRVHNTYGGPKLSVSSDGFATWVRVAGDSKAFARIEREGRAVHVTDIFRGSQPAGSGSQILVAGLRANGLRTGDQLVFKGIINPETLQTYSSGGDASASLLGRLGTRALGDLGLASGSAEFQMVRGKLNLVIHVL
jgi:hypothetical protein